MFPAMIRRVRKRTNDQGHAHLCGFRVIKNSNATLWQRLSRGDEIYCGHLFSALPVYLSFEILPKKSSIMG